ncbi:hypothetical protein P153DRAFT_384337 [Dothidotthia symphoricarpi CBS 119687]|uniref:Uncharacterized protein n=1 Tax=Dothidotthia symphoricarpi CBS 119687 TaxID=1392245 RepID=A0A6A6AIS3_9PLEO|nr:uncharacterized protein P153DRAFT_384337 [Dothidotthia symphoricarpi CBS 119687]KAF2131123.1 hypothetical protein P153DRAFT_384337 [Dothidotthia symphoricarpi CBS 119687]
MQGDDGVAGLLEVLARVIKAWWAWEDIQGVRVRAWRAYRAGAGRGAESQAQRTTAARTRTRTGQAEHEWAGRGTMQQCSGARAAGGAEEVGGKQKSRGAQEDYAQATESVLPSLQDPSRQIARLAAARPARRLRSSSAFAVVERAFITTAPAQAVLGET